MSNQNKNNKKLNDLLDKAGKSEAGSLDAFEKEALEGFSTLGKTESLELKQELDARIQGELFSKEGKKDTKTYWYAAAGLLLLIGFSVYFINNNEPVKDANLAMHQAPFPDMAAPPQATISEKTESNTGVKAKDATARAEKVAEAPVQRSQKVMEDLATVAPAESPKPDKNTQGKLVNTTSAPQMAAASPIYENVKTVGQAEGKANDFGDVNAETDQVVVQSKEQVALTSPIKLETVTQAKKRAKSDKAPASSCSYSGDENVLKKEIKGKLVKEDLDQKFEALLIIDENNLVKKVEFIKTYDLTKKQQKQLVEILKTLAKFNCQAGGGLCEYKLLYTP